MVKIVDRVTDVITGKGLNKRTELMLWTFSNNHMSEVGCTSNDDNLTKRVIQPWRKKSRYKELEEQGIFEGLYTTETKSRTSNILCIPDTVV